MQEYMRKTLDYYDTNSEEYKREWTEDFLANSIIQNYSIVIAKV